MYSQILLRQYEEALKLDEVLQTVRDLASQATSHILAAPSDGPSLDTLLQLHDNTSQEDLVALRDNTKEVRAELHWTPQASQPTQFLQLLDSASNSGDSTSQELEFLRAASLRLSAKLQTLPLDSVQSKHGEVKLAGGILPPWLEQVSALGSGTEMSDTWMRISEITALLAGLEDIRREISLSELGRKLMELSLTLADLGLREDDFNLALKATEIYRHRSELDPDPYRLYLAASLVNLTDRLYLRGHSGDSYAAVKYVEEVSKFRLV